MSNAQNTNEMKDLNIIIRHIEALESKQENGNITMDEEVVLMRLVDKAEAILFS